MRKLTWTLAVVGLLGAGLAVTAILSLNRMIGRNRDHILDQTRSIIGRPVAVERMAVSLWGGIGVRLDQVRIGDDPQFGTSDFLAARAVVAHAKWLPLLRGELEVGRIELRQPRIALSRNAQGKWNYESIGGRASRASATANAPQGLGTVPSEHLPFLIARANIRDGTLTLTDGTQAPPRTTILQAIDLSVGDVSQTTPISFDLAAALQAETQNIHLRGTVGPLANPAAIPIQFDGAIGPLGPRAVRIDSLHLTAQVTPASVLVSRFEGRAFDGTYSLTGEIPWRHDGVLALKGACSNVAVAKLLGLVNEDAAKRVDGDGTLRLDLRAAGTTPAAIRSTVAGQVTADIAPGVIKDLNVVREVLGRLSNLPVVGDLVSRNVQSEYATLAADPDTHLRSLHATFQVADQRLRTDDLTVDAGNFGIRASGWIGFNEQADLLGVLTMSKVFSRDVVADLKEARSLLDDQGQLAVPFRLRGQLGVANPQPDTAHLIARLTQGIGSGSLKDLVGKLLGPARNATPSPRSEGTGSAIERGLLHLFRR